MKKFGSPFFNCRVCGLDQGFEPWGADGETPSFDICDCCGVEFGYGDFTIEIIGSKMELSGVGPKINQKTGPKKNK